MDASRREVIFFAVGGTGCTNLSGHSIASLGFLALLGAIGAKAGGANIMRATTRVTIWGALAVAMTAGIGKLFGAVV